MKMRRHDREITDRAKIIEIIHQCDCCRVGFPEADGAYILPFNFGFDEEKNAFYFHGANEGKKAELAKANPRVGFELDRGHMLTEGGIACEYSFKYQSVIGKGVFSIAADAEERRNGFLAIMKHYTGRTDWTFDESLMKRTAIYRLEVTEWSCKEHE